MFDLHKLRNIFFAFSAIFPFPFINAMQPVLTHSFIRNNNVRYSQTSFARKQKETKIVKLALADFSIPLEDKNTRREESEFSVLCRDENRLK